MARAKYAEIVPERLFDSTLCSTFFRNSLPSFCPASVPQRDYWVVSQLRDASQPGHSGE